MTPSALGISRLQVQYGKRVVLQELNLTLERGEWLGLVGANGSGKSTLLGCIAGRIPCADGNVWVSGNEVSADPLAARQHLGFAVDPGLLPEVLTGQQCLEVFAVARGMVAPDAATLELARSLQLHAQLAAPVGHYSYGMRQKLAVLLAVLGAPPLLLLDEAFNGLDSRSGLVLQGFLRECVARGDCAVVLATHALNIVERCATRVALLHEGRCMRQWDATALAELRDSDQGLEQALAGAILGSQAQ